MLRLSALLAAFVQYAVLSTAASVTVNVGTTYQTMDGFGFSEAFGYANGIVALSGAPQKQCLDLLFNTTNGAGLTILRNRIGSGGAGDSIEPTSPGSSSATPKYTWDGKDSGQVFVSQQALKYGVNTIYADAWSAPGFMKTNNNQNNGGYLCGVSGESCSSGDWRQAYANFIVQYIKYYQQAGVPISHVGFLNEPEYAPSYSSMLSDGTKAADFIKILYPTIKNAGLSTKIACCDAEGWNDQKTFTAQLIAAGVESELGVITSHSYTSSPTSPISTSLHVWQTEYADLDDAFSTTWYSNGGPAEGLTWAQHIYTAVVNANVSGYLHWVGAQANVNSAALIDIVGTTITPSGRLWAFAMFSRFVRPGAVRISATTSTSGLLTSAFKNTDGKVAVVIINTGASAQTATIAVSGYTAASVTGYLTDSSHTVASQAATLSGGQVSTSVPAHSMVTVVLSGSGGSSSSSTGTTTTATSTSTSSSTTTSSSPSGCTAALYGQCGGTGFTGCTVCASGSTCTYSNPYYSQCLA